MRIPLLGDAELSPEQAALKQKIQAGPRGRGATSGPFAIFLHVPAFGDLAQQLGAHCRFGTSIPERLSELAILVTASLWKAQYEWAAHAPIGERAGLSPLVIEDLRVGREPRFEAEDERAIYCFIVELYRTARISDQAYADAHAWLGTQGLVELIGIMGYYAMLAMLLNAFEMPPPAGCDRPFAEPSKVSITPGGVERP